MTHTQVCKVHDSMKSLMCINKYDLAHEELLNSHERSRPILRRRLAASPKTVYESGFGIGDLKDTIKGHLGDQQPKEGR